MTQSFSEHRPPVPQVAPVPQLVLEVHARVQNPMMRPLLIVVQNSRASGQSLLFAHDFPTPSSLPGRPAAQQALPGSAMSGPTQVRLETQSPKQTMTVAPLGSVVGVQVVPGKERSPRSSSSSGRKRNLARY
jgi:hypothetical protein